MLTRCSVTSSASGPPAFSAASSTGIRHRHHPRFRLAVRLGWYGLAAAVLDQGYAAEYEQHAGDHPHRDRFANDQRAEDHGDDRQQVGRG